MFHTISWQGYWLTLALLLAGYYLTIYFLYFCSDIKIWVHRKSTSNAGSIFVPSLYPEQHPSGNAQPSLFEDAPEFQRPDAGTEEHLVYSCMDELTAFFQQAGSRKWAKEELVQALRGILQKYPTLRTSGYKESLNNVLTSECEHYCSIHFSAEDVVCVWRGV